MLTRSVSDRQSVPPMFILVCMLTGPCYLQLLCLLILPNNRGTCFLAFISIWFRNFLVHVSWYRFIVQQSLIAPWINMHGPGPWLIIPRVCDMASCCNLRSGLSWWLTHTYVAWIFIMYQGYHVLSPFSYLCIIIIHISVSVFSCHGDVRSLPFFVYLGYIFCYLWLASLEQSHCPEIVLLLCCGESVCLSRINLVQYYLI
jgi:hypothetical protein